MESCDEAEGVAGQVVFGDLPDDLVVFVNFDESVGVTAGDEGVSVGESDGGKDDSDRFTVGADVSDYLALCVIFAKCCFLSSLTFSFAPRFR